MLVAAFARGNIPHSGAPDADASRWRAFEEPIVNRCPSLIHRRVLNFLAMAVALSACLAGIAGADVLIPAGFKAHRRPAQGGKVDWGRGFLIAEGRSKAKGVTPQDRAMAARGAEVIAARNAIAIANGIPIDTNGRFGNVRDGVVHVNGVLRGQKRISVDWKPNRNPPECIVRLSIPMWGVKGVASVVYDAHRRAAGRAVARRYQLNRREMDVSDEVLVIDARGMGIEPCLFPAIVGDDGRVLYDVSVLDAAGSMSAPVSYVETSLSFERLRASFESETGEIPVFAAAMELQTGEAASHGALNALFAMTLADDVLSLHTPPAGSTSRPATSQPAARAAHPASAPAPNAKPSRRRAVRALRTRPGDKTRIVLTKEDAEKLSTTAEGASLMREGRVIVVVDSIAAGAQGRGNEPPDRETLALAADEMP